MIFALEPILVPWRSISNVIEIAQEEVEEEAFAFAEFASHADDTDLKIGRDKEVKVRLTFFPDTFGSHKIRSSASMLTKNEWSSSTGCRILIGAGSVGKGISRSFWVFASVSAIFD
jgi:hypothetical protein